MQDGYGGRVDLTMSMATGRGGTANPGTWSLDHTWLLTNQSSFLQDDAPVGPLNFKANTVTFCKPATPQLNAKGQVSELVNSPAFLTHLQLPQGSRGLPYTATLSGFSLCDRVEGKAVTISQGVRGV